MDISSVTSSVGAYTNQAQQTQQAQQVEKPPQKSAERVELKEEAAPPPPVTNAQGQRTGTVISVTA
jgi:hypothetical protein